MTPKRSLKISSVALILILLSGCSLLSGPIMNPPSGDDGTPCDLPARPVIPDSHIEAVTIDGDTYVAYKKVSNEDLLIYIKELETAAKLCGDRVG